MAVGNNTIGSKFRNICFIGLNRVEYLPEKSDEAIFADSWRDVTDEQSRKHLSLVFFSPRDLDGDPVNPYLFLSNSMGDEHSEEESLAVSQQEFGDISLLDMCRISSAGGNVVNVLVVADVIFHWDINDCYIQPTTAATWARDIKQIRNFYPRSTKFHVYTNWDVDKIQDLKLHTYPVRELPLDAAAWINMPTFQEKYGLAMLLLSIMVAGGTYFGIYLQSKEMDKLAKEIQLVEEDAPNTNRYQELASLFSKQEEQMKNRTMIPLLFKDIASSIFNSGMKAEKFELRNFSPEDPTDYLLATITAKENAYKGWLQEEPIAKSLLANSVTMAAIRKPPGGGGAHFRLEGLVHLPKVSGLLEDYRQKLKTQQSQPPAPKAPETTGDNTP